MSNINQLIFESIFGDNYIQSKFKNGTLSIPSPQQRLERIRKNIASGMSKYEAYKNSINNHNANLAYLNREGHAQTGRIKGYIMADTLRKQQAEHVKHMKPLLKTGSIHVDPPSKESNNLRSFITKYRAAPAKLSNLIGK